MPENKITLTDDFNIYNMIKNVWVNRILFISIISAFGIGSIIYTLVVDPIWEVTSIIKPADPSEETTLNEASPIIGLSLGGYSHDPVINNILITLKSDTFLEIFYNRYKNNENLFEFDKDKFNDKDSLTVEELKRYDAIEKLNKIIDFHVNTDHNTITISVRLKDKYFAYDFLNDFLKTLKEYIAEQNIQEIENDFNFYTEITKNSNDPIINQMLEKKLMDKLEKKFKLSSNVFRIVQKPAVPAKRVFPKRTMIVVLTTFIGSLISFMTISLIPVFRKIYVLLKETDN
ncbi:MAG TPA: Wzz/FepE/Etk N-terminal domain-containing protein [Clostridiales bacterium]|nr:Wzz/FepE/Etk N-terminal domain-containing protein [Clostridiales bacterium]HQP69982.1 Wzz/FepE/Etk N-terminal domain-containing protein [Clostridiales bacterium]